MVSPNYSSKSSVADTLYRGLLLISLPILSFWETLIWPLTLEKNKFFFSGASLRPGWRRTILQCWKVPATRAYTCPSVSHCSFSHIDLVYVGAPFSLGPKEFLYSRNAFRSSFTQLSLKVAPADRLLRLSRYWVSDERVNRDKEKLCMTFGALMVIQRLQLSYGMPLKPKINIKFS